MDIITIKTQLLQHQNQLSETLQALSLKLEIHKIVVIVFAQISHSFVATYIHQHDAWYEYNHIQRKQLNLANYQNLNELGHLNKEEMLQ